MCGFNHHEISQDKKVQTLNISHQIKIENGFGAKIVKFYNYHGQTQEKENHLTEMRIRIEE